MSIKADNTEHEDEVETDNEQIIKLLRAILMCLEHMTDLEDVIDNVED